MSNSSVNPTIQSSLQSGQDSDTEIASTPEPQIIQIIPQTVHRAEINIWGTAEVKPEVGRESSPVGIAETSNAPQDKHQDAEGQKSRSVFEYFKGDKQTGSSQSILPSRGRKSKGFFINFKREKRTESSQSISAGERKGSRDFGYFKREKQTESTPSIPSPGGRKGRRFIEYFKRKQQTDSIPSISTRGSSSLTSRVTVTGRTRCKQIFYAVLIVAVVVTALVIVAVK